MLCLGFSGLVQASEEDEWARAFDIPCHPLVTQAECRSHQDLLARLPGGAERDAYFEQYLALVEERVQSCGCSRAQNDVGMLRSR
jgi:hypothetical protein